MPIHFDQGSNLSAPGPIGGTTPAAGNFTDLNSTDLDVTTGTKTASDPVSFTQTWNAGAVVFTALDYSVTDTASANASNLFNFQYTNASSTNFLRLQRLTSTTNMLALGGTGASFRVFEAAESNPRTCLDSTGLRLGANIFVRWTSASSNALGTVDVGFFRNAAGVIEVDDGTNANAYRDLKVRALRVDTAANAGSGTAIVLTGNSSIAVSNSLVSASSRILAVAQDQLLGVIRVTPGAGTFTIYMSGIVAANTTVQYFILP